MDIRMAPKLAMRNKSVLSNVTDCACYHCCTFFQTSEIKEWVDTNDKIVIVVGLDGSYIRGDFGKVTDLIKHSDKCIKFTGKCVDCLRDGKRTVTDAPFSAKISGSTAILDVGGDDKYICVCRTHWLRRNCVLTEDETFDRTIIDLSKI